jgi:hypothetical protein
MVANIKNLPVQPVTNETAHVVWFQWDGKTFIWDPHPSHGKSEHYELASVPKMVQPKAKHFANGSMELPDPIPGVGGMQLRVVPGAPPVWRHQCQADMVAAMQEPGNLNHKDPNRCTKHLSFVHQQLDDLAASVDAQQARLLQGNAELMAMEAKKARLAAEIREAEEQANRDAAARELTAKKR